MAGTRRVVIIQWTTNAEARLVQHMSVNHCGGNIFVAQKLLDGADIVARLARNSEADTITATPIQEAAFI